MAATRKRKTVEEQIAETKMRLKILEEKQMAKELKPELIKKIKACNSLPLLKALDDFITKESPKYDEVMKKLVDTED